MTALFSYYRIPVWTWEAAAVPRTSPVAVTVEAWVEVVA